MMTTTRYTKTVAAITLDGITYFAHQSMTAADGSPYLTTSIADARDYRPGEPVPDGYRLSTTARALPTNRFDSPRLIG